MRPLGWDAKRPGERDLFALDLARELRLPVGGPDTIGTATWAAPAPLVLHAAGVVGSVATAEISGGVAGETYSLTLTVVTAAGRTLIIPVNLPVR
jgi:hypothetical protein